MLVVLKDSITTTFSFCVTGLFFWMMLQIRLGYWNNLWGLPVQDGCGRDAQCSCHQTKVLQLWRGKKWMLHAVKLSRLVSWIADNVTVLQEYVRQKSEAIVSTVNRNAKSHLIACMALCVTCQCSSGERCLLAGLSGVGLAHWPSLKI